MDFNAALDAVESVTTGVHVADAEPPYADFPLAEFELVGEADAFLEGRDRTGDAHRVNDGQPLADLGDAVRVVRLEGIRAARALSSSILELP